MKQLPDFDLSIVIPFYKLLDEFKPLSPSIVKYYERNGIEVVIVIDKSVEYVGILNYIRAYPFVSWKVVVSNEECLCENLAKAFNIGIRQATKQYVLIMNPEQEFYTDVIYELREKLGYYPNHYAIGQSLSIDIREKIDEPTFEKYRHRLVPYGSIMARKEYFERVGGYSESNGEWKIEDDYLRRRLELAGIHRLFFPDSILIYRKDFSLGIYSYNKQRTRISQNVLSALLLPIEVNINKKSGDDFESVVYDWKEHPFAKQQCQTYLSSLKQFDILSDNVFENSYPLIALIPTYNESKRILGCLRSVEKYCDGIIVLDDDSVDDTYQIAQSKKMLVKAKKRRTEFNDKENRNILLDIASFFKAEWFIFIDADERFDDRFVDLREVMKKQNVDTVGVWIANLWDNLDTYRVDMEDTNPNSKNGLWLRGRMFRNKGWMQIRVNRTLHFTTLPYCIEGRSWKSKSLLIHLGYIDNSKRLEKYNFYRMEDRDKILSYSSILHKKCQLLNIQDIKLTDLEV